MRVHGSKTVYYRQLKHYWARNAEPGLRSLRFFVAVDASVGAKRFSDALRAHPR
jgi:hypothetical protein